MAEFNLLKKTADERRSELYGLAPYLVYKVGDRTYNYGAKAAADLFYDGALKDVNPTEILSIGAGVTSLSNILRGNNSLQKVHSRDWDLSETTSLSSAFHNCGYLKNIDLSQWDVHNITSCQSAFFWVSRLEEIDCTKWDTNKVSNFSHFAYSCLALKRMGLPQIKSGCNTSNMFGGCAALTDVRCGGLIYPSLSFAPCPLTAESVIDILEHLADTPDEGATITFKAGIYAGFTSAEREVIDALTRTAVGNGWTIVNLKDFAVYEWNQHLSVLNSDRTRNGVTLTNNDDGAFTLNGEATSTAFFYGTSAYGFVGDFIPDGHNGYTRSFIVSGEFDGTIIYGAHGNQSNIGTGRLFEAVDAGNYPSVRITSGTTIDSLTLKGVFIDLTQLFGAGNEPTDVALFGAWLEDNGLSGYQPYDAGTPRVLTKPSWIA